MMRLLPHPAFTLILTICSAILNADAQALNETGVARVYVAKDGRVHIVDAVGHETVAPTEQDQAGCSSPKISGDHRTVGWTVDYMTDGQTYPIPLVLLIYRSGKVIDRFSDDLMIWEWQFQSNGKRVAFATGPTHGTSTPAHYELRDTRTGRLISEYWEGKGALPKWAKGLRSLAELS